MEVLVVVRPVVPNVLFQTPLVEIKTSMCGERQLFIASWITSALFPIPCFPLHITKWPVRHFVFHFANLADNGFYL